MQLLAYMAENLQYDDAKNEFWLNSGAIMDLFCKLMSFYGCPFLLMPVPSLLWQGRPCQIWRIMCFALFSFLHHFLQLGDILLKQLYLLPVVGGYGYMSGSRTYNARFMSVPGFVRTGQGLGQCIHRREQAVGTGIEQHLRL